MFDNVAVCEIGTEIDICFNYGLQRKRAITVPGILPMKKVLLKDFANTIKSKVERTEIT